MIDGVLELDLPPASPDQAWSGSAAAFVVGPENALLVAPLQRLLAGDDLAEAARLFNPLVLVGPSGSGKSQLAQGAVRHWRPQLEPMEVEYFTAADFGRELQLAVAEKRFAKWQSYVRSLRLLVIEDLQRLRRPDPIQQELRQTIDAIVEAGGVVVVTAQCEPAALVQLDPGLRDRLAAGLIVRLHAPGLAARNAILRQDARSRRLFITDESLSQLAHREVGAAAELRGRLAGSLPVVGRTSEAGEADACSTAATNHSPPGGEERTSDLATLKQIIAVTARYFAVAQAALTGPSRRTSLVLARNVVVHLARRCTGLSYAEIGRALGGRDHTTIMHGDWRLSEQLAHDPAIQQTLDELDRLVR